jgi:endonuclease III related protein
LVRTFQSEISNLKSEIVKNLLLEIYRILLDTFGPRHWWPGETPFEVMVGAILTQNTSWRNVEKAIDRLKKGGVLTPRGIRGLEPSELADLIRSSGFFRIKAERLKAFVDFLFGEYDGSLEKMGREDLAPLREKLLRIKGIGQETCDSILLYGLGKPVFVVDAYTKRILSRHGIVSEKSSYGEIQKIFMDPLPPDERVYNEYHALLVELGKTLCLRKPKCEICPLKGIEMKNAKCKMKDAKFKIENRK